MSITESLQEMTHSKRIGGGVLRLPEVSELIGHIESGTCSEEMLEEMAAVPRGPTPVEWAAMRAGEIPGAAPEPEVEEVVDVDPPSDPEETPAPEGEGEPDPEAAPV